MSHANHSNSLAPRLKGATASIFLAMILHPGPQTVKSLQLATGYSFKPVRSALSLLEKEGLVRYETRIYAWVLESGTPLLRRLRQAMSLPQQTGQAAELELKEPESETAVRSLSTELSTAYPQAGGEGPTTTGESPDGIGESPYQVGESPVRNGKSSLSRAPITTAANSSNQSDQKIASKQAGTKRAKRRSPTLDGRQSALFSWLVRGGIGPNSPKMRELLASDLELETVQAHVLERQARKAGLVEDQPPFSAGLLIRKLLDGDPPPPLRCERCLLLPNRLGLCRCDLDAVIKR